MNPNKMYCQANKAIFEELDGRVAALEQGGGGGDGGWVLATSNLYSDYVDENGKFKKDFIVETRMLPLLPAQKYEFRKGFSLSENTKQYIADFESTAMNKGDFFKFAIEISGENTLDVGYYLIHGDMETYMEEGFDAPIATYECRYSDDDMGEETYTPLTFSQTLSTTTYRIWVKE